MQLEDFAARVSAAAVWLSLSPLGANQELAASQSTLHSSIITCLCKAPGCDELGGPGVPTPFCLQGGTWHFPPITHWRGLQTYLSPGQARRGRPWSALAYVALGKIGMVGAMSVPDWQWEGVFCLSLKLGKNLSRPCKWGRRKKSEQ